MVCPGLESRAAGWKVKTIPLSYGSTQQICYLFSFEGNNLYVYVVNWAQLIGLDLKHLKVDSQFPNFRSVNNKMLQLRFSVKDFKV